eukprot:5973158-Amphidinium_carterae.2
MDENDCMTRLGREGVFSVPQCKGGERVVTGHSIPLECQRARNVARALSQKCLLCHIQCSCVALHAAHAAVLLYMYDVKERSIVTKSPNSESFEGKWGRSLGGPKTTLNVGAASSPNVFKMILDI